MKRIVCAKISQVSKKLTTKKCIKTKRDHEYLGNVESNTHLVIDIALG